MSNLGIPIGDEMAGIDEGETTEVDPEVALQQILDDPNLRQHVTRTTDEGQETVIGYFRILFEPNQLRAVFHVPFSPSLKNKPTIEAHATDHQDARIRLTDCQKFGARFEVIKSRPSPIQDQVLVEVMATESS
jgi:hypothetical protein